MFEERSNSPELLDRPDMDESFAIRSYHFMSVVNKFFGGTAIVKRFILNELNTSYAAKPLRVLDIGSGICDIPESICKWAQMEKVDVEFTCVETNPYAIELTHENIRGYPNIKLVQEDIFTFQPSQKYDCATGSLFFHHFSDEDILKLIKKLHNCGCRSVLINDLHRSFLCYAGCIIASLFIRSDVRHDALLSIRKGFKPAELRSILQPIGRAEIKIGTAWFGRVYAVIQFTEDPA